MAINQFQISKAQSWLDEKATKNLCSSCGSNRWQIDDIFAPSVVYHGKTVTIGSGCRPMLQIFCENCAQVDGIGLT